MIKTLKEEYYKIYKNRTANPVFFFSPGRVNLIGEHTDYNMGFVLPCALDFGTYLAAVPNKSGNIRLSSLNFDYYLETPVDSISKNTEGKWVNYPLGVIVEFLNRGLKISGLDLLYSGNIPNGAGLSSSASIEMVTAVAINYLFSAGIDMLDMVRMSKSAENNFVGINCGIMDQFAVGFGKRDCAVFLNCDTLEHRNVPLVLNDYELIIVNTNKRRELTGSGYNQRRSECETAVRLVSKIRKTDHLSQLSVNDINLLEKTIDDRKIIRRARHVITENKRVLEAVNSLYNGDIIRFGELMNASHDSLKNDYDVTGDELDTLVYEARKIDGVIGSRMTGAGFGGCTVNLVKSSKTDEFICELNKKYTSITGLKADFYRPATSNGAGIVRS
jgi:galactokinase